MTLVTKKRETTDMTDFGYYLSALIKDRHFDNLTQYSERLHEDGRGATPQMISRYRRDKTPVPVWFVGRSIEVLDLDEAEIDKFVQLWFDTLPAGERAVMEWLWNTRPEQRDLKDLEDYERQREKRNGGGNGDGESSRN